MKFYAVATLFVRLCGMLLLVVSAPFLPITVFALIAVIQNWFVGGPGWWSSYPWDRIILACWPIVMCALGFYMPLGGKWLLRVIVRGLAGKCPYCGYTIHGLSTDKCPECGVPIERREPVVE